MRQIEVILCVQTFGQSSDSLNPELSWTVGLKAVRNPEGGRPVDERVSCRLHVGWNKGIEKAVLTVVVPEQQYVFGNLAYLIDSFVDEKLINIYILAVRLH